MVAEKRKYVRFVARANTYAALGSSFTKVGKIRDISMSVYQRAVEHAESCGIILADTKFELATIGDEIVLVDEVCTPDSSRFWAADEWTPGVNPDSFDKQIVRDWLESTGWNKLPPPPEVPAEVIEKTRQRYETILQRLTGLESD